MAEEHDTYQGIMDSYGDFLLGPSRYPGFQQVTRQTIHLADAPPCVESSDSIRCAEGMVVAGQEAVDPYMPTQISDDSVQNLLGHHVAREQPACGSFTEMPQDSFYPRYEHILHEPMGSENKTFMITGRDGRGSYPEEPDDGQCNDQDPALSDDDACVSEDENAETYHVSVDSENLSTAIDKTAQTGNGQTHRFDKQAHAEHTIEVEQLSKEDIENYLQNETLISSQSCSQEIRAQHVPRIDMSFCSHVEAFAFYNTYASIVGFSAKIAGNYHRRGTAADAVTRYTYRCNRAGKVVSREVLEERKRKRDQNRKTKDGLACPVQLNKPRNKNSIDVTDCHATMVVTLKGDKWIVTKIELEHNHVLSPPGEAKFLRSHKHMTDEEKLLIRTMNAVKLPSRKIMAILAGFRGGISALPYTKKDINNYRTAIRNESNQNDMMMVIDFFKKKQMEDPRFYYAFRIDDENKVQNIFWADGHCRRFYHLYGDCVSFDTTYKTNKYNLPFAPFVGITGHGDNCLFACAILQNETIETFTWLFEEFLQCMRGKMPLTIITDQDVAMKQAIPRVFTQTTHRNCLFHIKKKAEEKCARCFATKRTLHVEFNDIINRSQTEEEFETLWQAMIQKYRFENVKYFQHMWEIRKNFVPVYFKKDFFSLHTFYSQE
ncbi:protein FAR1-RELATED SEQUENCE 5-like [Brachypodium distachyon]|uniref:Uncharacterized protein n=1 Tax=Brachypodium distachyon TaxID=15368 RepID=A0A2K2CX72_BRADI|nr:protein FAR1-RELATED SEQUENCE 5-like [Brachypodium distachyon]PNT66616.1 hypothetical protein BRADI_3g14892v3 [Brachypodium distachyon]|eukprot:XP_024317768.1 protein FAR1-RELATED SEQUENCE 5-like [Brachypodium distachyon]